MQPRTLLLAVLVAVSFLGCSARSADKGKVVVTYTRWGDPSELESTRDLIAQFEKENPDIRVRLDVVGWNQYWQKMKTATVTDTAQDVWLMSAAYVEEYASAGHLLDLMPFVKADPTFQEDDFFPHAFDAYSFAGPNDDLRPVKFGQGRLFAFTRDYNTSALYYNRDHFDALGLAYPNENWTWDDLVAAAQKLTIDFDGDGVVDQWGFAGVMNWMAFAGRIGAGTLDVEHHKSTYNTPLVIKTIMFCQDLIHRYKVHPPRGTQADETEDFVTGKVSMTIAGAWNLRKCNRSQFRWDIAPIPMDRNDRPRRGGGGGTGHCIYALTRHPNEAWRLVRFLAGDSAQRILARSGTSIPVLKRAAFSDDFLAPFDRPPKSSYHVIFDVLAHDPIPPTYCRGYLEYNRRITDILDYVWRNKKTPEEACKLIDEVTNGILDEKYRGAGQ